MKHAVFVWGAIFVLHLALLAYLVGASGYLPGRLGIVLALVSLGYFVQSFGTLLYPQGSALFSIIGMASMIELAFPLWLVIKGIKTNQAAILCNYFAARPNKSPRISVKIVEIFLMELSGHVYCDEKRDCPFPIITASIKVIG